MSAYKMTFRDITDIYGMFFFSKDYDCNKLKDYILDKFNKSENNKETFLSQILDDKFVKESIEYIVEDAYFEYDESDDEYEDLEDFLESNYWDIRNHWSIEPITEIIKDCIKIYLDLYIKFIKYYKWRYNIKLFSIFVFEYEDSGCVYFLADDDKTWEDFNIAIAKSFKSMLTIRPFEGIKITNVHYEGFLTNVHYEGFLTNESGESYKPLEDYSEIFYEFMNMHGFRHVIDKWVKFEPENTFIKTDDNKYILNSSTNEDNEYFKKEFDIVRGTYEND